MDSEISVILLHSTTDPTKHIEHCGRICYNSYDKTTDDSADGFVKGLINRKHLSVLEHAHASFSISGVSRSLTHQLVRHRLASYSQESQRYVKISTLERWFVIPKTIKDNKEAYLEYMNAMLAISRYYEKLCNLVPKEDARYVLPNACKTNIIMSGNFRVWFEFFEKRLDSHAQWEIRELSELLREQLYKISPVIFDKSNLRRNNMAEGGIRAGDPLIKMLTDALSLHDITYKVTAASGSKRGDGDVYTKNLILNVCFDGKYVIEPKVNPKFLSKELEKVKHQAESIDRIGIIITNTDKKIYAALELDDLLTLLEHCKK